MVARVICFLALLFVLARSAPHITNEDIWEESSNLFGGILSDHVANYTCGQVQIGSCSPRGGSCSGGVFGSDLNSHCVCKPGFYQSKCDWGPVPTDAEPSPSNGIDWTSDKVARVAVALDAATAAYANNTVNGVLQTTVEAQCPTIKEDYDYLRLYNLADMNTEQCGGVLECGQATVDTQLIFGILKASAAPSAQRELVISFRGTEGSDVFSSWQKFQDLTSDLAIGRKFLYVNASGGPCSDNSQCEYLGYVHEGFYYSVAPFMQTILLGITDAISYLNGMTTEFPSPDPVHWIERAQTLSHNWDSLIIPEVTVTGHSLGAALASICGSVIDAVFEKLNVHLYTFASPRVGGPTWASLVEGAQDAAFNIVRFVNKHDPVTMIPTSLGAGDAVVHVGKQETVDFASISSSCRDWFLDSQYSIISAASSYFTGCLDIGSHTDYYQHIVTWLRSKGYNKAQRCNAGSC
jgi:hypothetical protein